MLTILLGGYCGYEQVRNLLRDVSPVGLGYKISPHPNTLILSRSSK